MVKEKESTDKNVADTYQISAIEIPEDLNFAGKPFHKKTLRLWSEWTVSFGEHLLAVECTVIDEKGQ